LTTQRFPLDRPRTKAKAIALLLQGKSYGEVAGELGVTKQAVHAFSKRHAAEIAQAVAEVERQITDYAIAQKVNRIADAQWRRDLMVQVLEARAKGESGVESGIVCTTYKERRHYNYATGEYETEYVPEYKVDTAFLKEWRENERGVAEALDHLPRSGVTINDNRSVTLVRYIEAG